MCSAVSKNTPREGKIGMFLKKYILENTLNNNFLLNLKNLYTIFEKILVKNFQFFVTILVLSYSKVLMYDKTSNNRIQIVVKLSTEINQLKIFNLQ